MQKMALFVEGLTEQLFVEKLVKEIAGIHKIRVKVEKVKGSKDIRRFELVSEDDDIGQPCYVLIRNCHGDHNVGSDIHDQYDSLVANGYISIIGIRDLYPKSVADLPILLGLDRRSLNFRLKSSPIRVVWVIAQMEIEAWFLAEHTHLQRIHSAITVERVLRELGIDLLNEDMELRPHPTEDLHSIYILEGFSYTKKQEELKRTVDAIDFTRIYADLPQVKQLNILIQSIEDFISSC